MTAAVLGAATGVLAYLVVWAATYDRVLSVLAGILVAMVCAAVITRT